MTKREVHPSGSETGPITQKPSPKTPSQTRSSPLFSPPGPDVSRRREVGAEFSRWLEERRETMGERWFGDIETRAGGLEPHVEGLVRSFIDLFLILIPCCLGPLRSQFQPLWRQCAELYGSVAGMRGLAAGEVIEEVQFLRESVIRLLFSQPPLGGRSPLLLREILRLNRVIDHGVTYASVGHTDALFFALFRGSGAPRSLDPELLGEIEEQLEGIRSETGSLRRLLERRVGGTTS